MFPASLSPGPRRPVLGGGERPHPDTVCGAHSEVGAWLLPAQEVQGHEERSGHSAEELPQALLAEEIPHCECCMLHIFSERERARVHGGW